MAGRRTTDDRLLVYGTNAVQGLLRSGYQGVQVYLRAGGRQPELAAALADSDAMVTEVSQAELERLTGGGRHQGVAARVGAFHYVGIPDLVSAPGRGAVVLDGIMDPRNLGAITRSARAAGVRGLVLPRDRSASITATVATASAGTVFGLAVARVPNLNRAIRELKDAGMWIVGLTASAETTLSQVPRLDDPVIVVGGEGDGLRRLVRERCDFLARVPMAGPVESLNASVAVGIALYELVLRRRDGV